ncbi:odorant receptor 94a [Rhagoletis pomonella]|uniref:odorant receptor 94a n=1 Tax=Rhagoletis pomonella TaxID=28610 RepID=UPI00177F3A60|nr:odorant receptor 94a [Rhagoletis pomonella]
MLTKNSPNSSTVISTTRGDRIASVRSLIIVLKVIGLWQWPEDRTQWERTQFLLKLQRVYGLALHLPLTFTLITLMVCAALLSHDLEEISNVLYILLTEFALVVKIFSIWQHGTLAWRYLDELVHSSKYEFRQQAELTQWMREQRLFVIVAYSYIFGSCSIVVFSCFGALYTAADVYVLPYAYYVPFEWRDPHNYWYAWSYCCISVSLTCVANVTLDMIFCYFMLHLSMLYKLIGWRLAALRQRRDAAGAAEVLNEMRHIFQLHESVNRLAAQCETLVSVPVLSQIILSAFILCFSGYRLQHLQIMENVSVFFATILFVSSMTLQIFLPCYYGNMVTVNSNALTNDMFNSDWTAFEIPARKFMILYMELLKRPTTLKAGNFFLIGLPIFTKTMNNAYSFFALLLKMNK